MSTALATSVPVPSFIAAVAQKDAYLEQFGDMQAADLKLNMIKIAYSDSKTAKPGWGPTGQEAPLPAGTMYLSRSGQIVAPETSFIPLFRNVRFIAWSGRPGDGEMLFSTNDRNDEKIKHYGKDPSTGKWINGLDFLKDARGKTQAPLVTTYINFYVFLPICDWPCLLTFKRTSAPAGHQFSSDLMMATILADGRRIPMHSLKFKFGVPKTIDGEGGKDYYHITWKAAGYVDNPVVFQKATEMAKTAEAINNITSDNAMENDDAVPSVPENLKQASPATVTVSSPPVQQAPVQQAPTVVTAPPGVPPAPAPVTITPPPAQVIVTPPAPVQPAAPMPPPANTAVNNLF